MHYILYLKIYFLYFFKKYMYKILYILYQIIPYSKINDKCFLNVPSYLEGVQLVLLLCYYLFSWICCSDLFK